MRPSPTAQLNVQTRRRFPRQTWMHRFRLVARGVLAACGVSLAVAMLYGLTFIPFVERATPKVLHLEGQGAVMNTFNGVVKDPAVLKAAARRACLVPRYRRAFSASPTTARIRWTTLGTAPVYSRVDCRTLRVG